MHEDICTLIDTYDLWLGEGRHHVSWIWGVCGYGEQAPDAGPVMHDGIVTVVN